MRTALNSSAAQIVALLVLFVGLWPWDLTVAWSVVLGGLTGAFSQAWFAFRLFRGNRRDKRSRSAGQTSAPAGYGAVAGRFALAAVGFALVFALVRPVSPAAVFAGFGLVTVMQWLSAWRLLKDATGDRPADGP